MAGPLLTARAVADIIGVSSETVLRWTRNGSLPAIRLPGGAIRYREQELEQWLASRATVASTTSGPAALATPGPVTHRRQSPVSTLNRTQGAP
jgi:excisionase family DNA binding protein